MKIQKVKIGNKEVMPFTIPSGIVTTEPSCLERMANNIPELGVLTTKSIGPVPRAGNREPILAQYMPGGFVNAVGLTNPGAEEFAKKLSHIKLPEDKFLLCSIFGGNVDEFAHVARTLEPHADGFELNLSCPHAQGHGLALGQDKELSDLVVKTVSGMTKKPVFVKLSPALPNIAESAESAMKAGAYGITAINTVGPGYWSHDGNPILTNKVGGMSGRGVLPLGLKCVREITQKLGKIPLIGMGGIATEQDVEEYARAGASIFGIGSALAGMSEWTIKEYFEALAEGRSELPFQIQIPSLLREVDMSYMPVKITKLINSGCDFKLIETDLNLASYAGQFVFAWIPGVGEKPFSIMDDEPLTLGILERGQFTKAITSLKEGDSFYVRGPYGNQVNPLHHGQHIGLVAGGCGIAGVYLLAKQFANGNYIDMFFGAKDKEHLPALEKFEKFGQIHVATEDGSLGTKGLVTNLLENHNFPMYATPYFFNCGPKKMNDAILPIERRFALDENIYSSLDYMTRCGVGICGSCADEKGRRTCVEGPFMPAAD